MTTRYTAALLALFYIGIATTTLKAEESSTPAGVGQALPVIDTAIQKAMQTAGADAATVAISRDGKVLYSRGYGWADRAHQVPVESTHLFRIASNSKPITSAIVKRLIRTNRLKADQPVFEYLGIEPYNRKLGDQRLGSITVAHLLEHKGGWDKSSSFDPMYRLTDIRKELRLRQDLRREDVIRFMLAQPLQFDPGSKSAYANFGYVVLGEVIEKATGKSYQEAVETELSKQLRVDDIRVSEFVPKARDPREVTYVRQTDLKYPVRAPAGGLATSAETMCKFMSKYWVSGEPRKRGDTYRYYHFGSLPDCTTALMEQRLDGIDYAVMLNARRNQHFSQDNELLRKDVSAAIDQVLNQRR